MKPLCLILSLSLCGNMFGTVRTVSNNPGTVAQYTTIQAAVNASVSGDTIYIHGSNTSYGNFNVTDKRLIYIGPGWAPLNNFNPLKASIASINFTGAGCDNSELQGLVFTGQLTLGINHPNSIRFIRNQFIGAQVIISYGTGNFSGFVFQDNFFDRGQIVGNQNNSYTNCVIQNNIFYHDVSYTGSIYGLTNSIGVLIDHNLFYGPSYGNGVAFAGDCRALLITNNIFVRKNAASNCSASTFNNNITYQCGVDTPWVNNGNIGNNNVAGQNPQMVDQAAVNNGTGDPLLNFTIAAGPANNSGTDNKDMGLLFDATGILNWSNSRMSRLPYIYSMIISNPNIPAGGTLNVQVEARKNN